MKDSKPVFIADSCIGGLSVVKSMWASGGAGRAIFMADYAINPLGLKSDSEIAQVAENWLRLAGDCSDTLVMACNTLSIRYHQLVQSGLRLAGPENVVSMVDCFKAMVKVKARQLANRRVLVIGTEFTASQDVYPGLLQSAVPGVRVASVAATVLERKIARFQPWESEDEAVINPALRQALENTDMAVLACTCFPMVKDRLSLLFPDVIFLDPAVYCAGLLKENNQEQGIYKQRHKQRHEQRHEQDGRLTIRVTGDVVSSEHVTEFARSYLNDASILSG